MEDALQLFSEALTTLSNSTELVTERLNCRQPDVVSSHGKMMIKEMLSSEFDGKTGRVMFSGSKRAGVNIHLVKWTGERTDFVGVYNTNSHKMKILERLKMSTKEDIILHILVSTIN